MSSDPAQFMTSLLLHIYKNNGFLIIKREICIKHKSNIANIFRFIDELFAIDGKELFEKYFTHIYSFRFKIRSKKMTYVLAGLLLPKLILEMDTNLFQKPDSFPSKQVRMPFCISNIIRKGKKRSVRRYTFLMYLWGLHSYLNYPWCSIT